MQNPQKHRHGASLALAAAILIPGGIAFSQEEAEDETFELSPFVVDASKDTGYAATSTLSGTRLNTEVRNIATPLTILTDEFLNDIGATSFDDLVEFMPSTETYRFDDSDIRGEQSHNGRTFSSRGFRADNQSRDFFNTAIPLDTYNSGPISFNRGPNSNLFGIGSAGGGLSFGYRQAPLDRVTNEVQARFDSEDSRRFVLRHTSPIIEDKLALSLSLLDEDRRGFRDPQYAKRSSGTLGLEWHPTEHTTVQLNHESGNTETVRPYSFTTYDWTTEWLNGGTPTEPILGLPKLKGNQKAASVATNVENTGTDIVRILGTDLPLLQFNDSFGYGRRTRVDGNLERVGITDERYMPLETNTAGIGNTRDIDFDASIVRVQHRIATGLYAEFAARRENIVTSRHDMLGSNSQAIFIDPNPILPTGADNPYYGKPYIESDSNRIQFGDSTDEGWRLGLAYDKNLPDYEIFGKRLGRIRLAGFYSDETSESTDYRLTQKAAATYVDDKGKTIVAKNIQHRLYLEDGNRLPDGLDMDYTQAAGGDGIPEVNSVWEEGTAAGDRNDRAGYAKALSFNAHALLLDDTLSLIAGWREDETLSENFDPGEENTQLTVHDTASFGVVYHLTKSLSLFGNYGENFRPGAVGRNDVWANIMPSNLGESHDMGIRFSLMDRKITGGLTYYETDQINQLRNDLGNIVNDFDDVWDTLEYAYETIDPAVLAAAGLPAAAPARPNDATALWSGNDDENNGNPGAIYADTLDSSSRGIEFEMIANPTDNWRLSLSVSKHLSTVSAARKSTAPYYEQFRPVWESYVDAANTIMVPSDADNNGDDIEWIQADNEGVTLATLLDSIADEVDEAAVEVGGQRYGNRAWSANLVTRYTFGDGILKGWNAGGSARWRDEALVGYGIDSETGFRDPNDPYISEGYVTLDAFVGFATRLKNGVRWDSTLRVRNLNHDDVWLSVAAARDDGTGARFDTRQVVMAPISVELSTRFRF